MSGFGAPRPCPACGVAHPVGTTCATGWGPWDGSAHVPQIVVTLTDEEYARAVEHAVQIVALDDRRGWRMKFDPVGGETALDVNTRGYAAELAASLATGLGIHWDILPEAYRRSEKPPDIGRRTEVRCARRPGGPLVARPGDPRPWTYLLLTGRARTYRVVGWLEGEELMVPDLYRSTPPPPCYMADQRLLRPLPLPVDA